MKLLIIAIAIFFSFGLSAKENVSISDRFDKFTIMGEVLFKLSRKCKIEVQVYEEDWPERLSCKKFLKKQDSFHKDLTWYYSIPSIEKDHPLTKQQYGYIEETMKNMRFITEYAKS